MYSPVFPIPYGGNFDPAAVKLRKEVGDDF